MKYAIFPILMMFLFGCSGSQGLAYRDLIKGMPAGDKRITGTMYPVIKYYYAINLEKYAGQPNADSIAISETAKTAGIYLVEAYRSGQFIYGGSKKAKRAKRENTMFDE